MSERVQDLVIGGGAIGVNCAHALADAGRSVVLVDKGEICSGCSHGNAGWVTPSHAVPIPAPGLVAKTLKWMLRGDSPLYIKPTLRPAMLRWLWGFYRHCNHEQAMRGLEALARLHRVVVPWTLELVERYKLDCEFRSRGLLYVCQTEQAFDELEKESKLMGDHGILSEVLDGAEARQREPVLDGSVCGGVFFPDEATFVPDRFVKQLAKELPSMGVRLVTGATVQGFVKSGRQVTRVETSAGTFEPETVILAAGAWSTELSRQLGLRIHMEAGKGYSLTFRGQEGTPSVPLCLVEVKVGVTPWSDRVRLAGTLELAGCQLDINQTRVNAILRGAKRYLPRFAGEEVEEVWAGMRPVSTDVLPIIGPTGRATNVYLATGHAMLGLTQAVATGRLIAELVTGKEPSIPMEAFCPDRFSS